MVTVGVIRSDAQFHRPPGDVRNVESYPCRAIFEIARGVTAREMVAPEPNPALLEPYPQCALKLQERGADLVTTTLVGFARQAFDKVAFARG
jgi:hypothetical protein